ncbi:rod-binding protein [Desulfobulbus propionicus]|jgi:flagellar protein FlgJ
MKTQLDNTLALAGTQTPASRKTPQDRAALKKSCQDFEAIFIQSMFKAMRKTIPDGGLFAKDHATEMYQDMLDQEVASTIAQRQSLGLAEQMYRQMEKLLPPETK